ncbi:MAG: alpha/beta hydrolase [Candidatus Binataceae bacterium]
MGEPRSFFIEGSPRLHCLEWNPAGGDTLLLLHGNSANAWWWAPMAAWMPPSCRLIAIDLRGHGDSEGVRPAAYGPSDHATDLARLITTMGLELPIVAGHSMGGVVVTAFTQAHPRLARAAVAIDIPVTSTPRRNRFLRYLRVLPTINYPDLATAMARFRLMPNQDGIAPEVIAEIARHSLIGLGDGRYTMKFDRESFYGGDGLDIAAALEQVQIPALLVRAQMSRIMTAEGAERAAASNPLVRLHTIGGAHHHIPLENPHALADVIAGFAAAIG